MSGFIAAAVVIAAGATIYESEASRRAANKANNAAKQQATVEAQQKRVAAITQTRMAQAQVANQGGSSGTGSSSGVQGAIGSLGSQANYQIGTANQLNELGAIRFDAQHDMANAAAVGSIGRAVGSAMIQGA